MMERTPRTGKRLGPWATLAVLAVLMLLALGFLTGVVAILKWAF